MIVFISGCRIVIIEIRIRADLNTSERDLRPGIGISIPRSTHQRPYIRNQRLLLCTHRRKSQQSADRNYKLQYFFHIKHFIRFYFVIE